MTSPFELATQKVKSVKGESTAAQNERIRLRREAKNARTASRLALTQRPAHCLVGPQVLRMLTTAGLSAAHAVATTPLTPGGLKQ